MAAKIGIELEFLVAHPDCQLEPSDLDKTDRRWPEVDIGPAPANEAEEDDLNDASWTCMIQVCRALALAGIPVACEFPRGWGERGAIHEERTGARHNTLDDEGYLVWNQHLLTDTYIGDKSAYWIVMTNFAVSRYRNSESRERTPAGYNWHSVAVRSPLIFNMDQFSGRLPKIHELLSGLRANMKLWINSQVGMSLHANKLGAPKVDIITARRVTALTIVLEDVVMFPMSHPSRRNMKACRPILSESRLGKVIEVDTSSTSIDTDNAAIFTIIGDQFSPASIPPVANDAVKISVTVRTALQYNDVSALAKALSVASTRETEYSPAAFAISSHGNMEFRYPEASFDMEFIEFWSALTDKIVEIAGWEVVRYANFLAALLMMRVRAQPASLEAFLNAIGLSSWVGFAMKRQHIYRTTLQDLDDQPMLPPPE